MKNDLIAMAVIILATACGLFFGISGIRSKGRNLPKHLRPYDIKFAIVQLGVGVIGLCYLIYFISSR